MEEYEKIIPQKNNQIDLLTKENKKLKNLIENITKDFNKIKYNLQIGLYISKLINK